MADCTPAGAAHLKTALLARPQFEADFSGQRPVSSQKRWADLIRAQAGLDCQLHEAPDFRGVECFKEALGGHICCVRRTQLCRFNQFA
jgi:hypothetical protein